MSRFRVRRFISGGETRCVQATFRMAVETFTGTDPGEAYADELTGYVEGRGTWQFRMLLALADLGLNAIDHERLDIDKFVVDPEGAIRDQAQDEQAIRLILDETDLESETAAARACIDSTRLQFVNSIPSMQDLIEQVSLGRLVMCNVDLQVLERKPEREGHILLVEEIDDLSVVAHDPGPHGKLCRQFDRDLFERAWRSPSPAMANLISVWQDAPGS